MSEAAEQGVTAPEPTHKPSEWAAKLRESSKPAPQEDKQPDTPQEEEAELTKVDETEESFRLRQRDPDDFVAGSLKTTTFAEGIQSVIGRLRPSLRKAAPKKKKRTNSREYLEAALTQAKKLLPGWMFAAIHRAAFPAGNRTTHRAGSRRKRRDLRLLSQHAD